jgi:hypothetical protein
VAGVVVNAALDIGGRWLNLRALPLGAAASIALLYFLAFFMSTAVAVPVFTAIVLAALVAVVILRLRAVRQAGETTVATSLRQAMTPGVPDTIVAVVGILGGVIVLLPLLRLGFPTTIAYSNNDGWAYVGNIDWLHDNAFGPRVVPDMEEPTSFSPFSQLRDGFGVGFELLASATMVLLRRSPFEMVNAVSAVGIPIAVAGWASLWRSVTGRLETHHALLVGLGALSPVFILPYTENYTPQFVSLSFMPFAMASFVHYARQPSLRRVIPAALGSGAVLGVYPPLAPWLLPPLVLGAFVGAGWPSTWSGWRDLRAHVPRLRRTAFLLAGFGLTLLVIAPIPLRHTLRWFTSHSPSAGVPFPRFADRAYVIFGSGLNTPFGYITGAPLSWSVTALALIVVPILFAGLLLPLLRPERGLRALLPLSAGIAIATTAGFVAFRLSDPLGYGLYKSLIAGCSLGAGLAILGLLPLTGRRFAAPRLMAIGILVAAWLPVSAQLIQQMESTTTGFRAADVELGRALADLPDDAIVLIEGAAEEPGSFQIRMMASYFGADYAGLRLEGLGSTASYITPGGPPPWRPDRAWDYAVTIRDSSLPFRNARPLVWTNGTYWIWKAARGVEVTPFSPTWYGQETDAEGTFQWTAGNVQMVLSNPSARAERVVLRFTATSYAQRRTLTVAEEGTEGRTLSLPGSARTRVALPVSVPADGTAFVTLTSDPGQAPAPPPDARQLSLRLQDISVTAP